MSAQRKWLRVKCSTSWNKNNKKYFGPNSFALFGLRQRESRDLFSKLHHCRFHLNGFLFVGQKLENFPLLSHQLTIGLCLCVQFSYLCYLKNSYFGFVQAFTHPRMFVSHEKSQLNLKPINFWFFVFLVLASKPKNFDKKWQTKDHHQMEQRK